MEMTERERRLLSARNTGRTLIIKRRKGRPQKTYGSMLKQSHFRAVEYYIQGMTQQQALLKAGYSASVAEKASWTVFGREDVRRAIEERRNSIQRHGKDIVARIQEELARIAFFNIGNILNITDDGEFIYDFSEATMDEFAALGEVTVETYMEGKGKDAERVKRVKIKPHDKKAALDSLARINGMFQDNLNINPEGGSIEERLMAGRNRVKKIEAPTIEAEFEEVEK